tara:strand:+ start:1924 stop:2148 length:225 start_codon:yes stop_codon:yes gene_type:complete
MNEALTADEIASQYSAAMDSVNLITKVLAAPADYVDDSTVLARNVEHLKLVVAKDYWTTEDLTPLNNAIAAGEV